MNPKWVFPLWISTNKIQLLPLEPQPCQTSDCSYIDHAFWQDPVLGMASAFCSISLAQSVKDRLSASSPGPANMFTVLPQGCPNAHTLAPEGVTALTTSSPWAPGKSRRQQLRSRVLTGQPPVSSREDCGLRLGDGFLRQQRKVTPPTDLTSQVGSADLVGLFGDRRRSVPHPGNLLRLENLPSLPGDLGSRCAGGSPMGPLPRACEPQGPWWNPAV